MENPELTQPSMHIGLACTNLIVLTELKENVFMFLSTELEREHPL